MDGWEESSVAQTRTISGTRWRIFMGTLPEGSSLYTDYTDRNLFLMSDVTIAVRRRLEKKKLLESSVENSNFWELSATRKNFVATAAVADHVRRRSAAQLKKEVDALSPPRTGRTFRLHRKARQRGMGCAD